MLQVKVAFFYISYGHQQAMAITLTLAMVINKQGPLLFCQLELLLQQKSCIFFN